MYKRVFTVLATAFILACGQTEQTIINENIGEVEQELIHVGSYDPQHKFGVFYEQGPFHQVVPEFGSNTFPFGAYVIWEGNNFALVSALGSMTVDLLAEDATTFPAAVPSQPIMYEYGEDADCDWAPLRLTCEATAHAYFAETGIPPVTVGLEWKMTKYPGDPYYVFHSEIPGESLDAFNYPVHGVECEAAVERIVNFFDSKNVEFTVLELDVEELCD